jgi:hypothetical protein
MNIQAVPEAIVMVWYSREDYKAVLAVMDDAAGLPATYDKWRRSAERGAARFAREGKRIIRTPLDPREFALWCEARGIRKDGRARNQFAVEKARRAFDR